MKRYRYRYEPMDPDGQHHVFMPLVFDNRGDEPNLWCREQFGKRSHPYEGARWSFVSGAFYFRDQDDAFAFKMVWG